MKLVTYDTGKTPRAGLAVGEMIVDLELGAAAGRLGKLPTSVRALLEAGPAALARARRLDKKAAALVKLLAAGKGRRPVWLTPLDRAHLNPPIPDPEKVICLGLNYMDHCREQEGKFGRSVEPPPNPIIFAKFPSTLTGPRDPIRLPSKKVTQKVDYEVELAMVIGTAAKGVSVLKAMEHVAGYMVMNDVSARDCQFSDKQWVRAKSFDTFGPCGPWLATPDEIDDPHALRLWTRVNGVTLQDGTTGDLIFRLPQVIAFLSQAITLRPGDVISTGTPSGVGIFREPPILLQGGDVVECGIEGLGALRNRCVAAPVKRAA